MHKEHKTASEESITIWREAIPASIFSKDELEYLRLYIGNEVPPLESIWSEMDQAWDELGLDNKIPLAEQDVSGFYTHPVWMLNAIFTAADPVSVMHRESIARYISNTGSKRIADYGGGGGELARQVSILCPDVEIEIIEPFPSALGKHRISGLGNVRFNDRLDGKYDLIVAQDVLEHVDCPVVLAGEIFGALRQGGAAIFANCFFPVIKCHLPGTFHLRATFGLIMRVGGFKSHGVVRDAGHAQIFIKQNSRESFLFPVFLVEQVSRRVGWILILMARTKKSLASIVGSLKNMIRSNSH